MTCVHDSKGSYVIDSPEDKNMTVRQQCLRYQESHRGIVRAKIESLPDIPKRCHLKSVPVVTLKDTSNMATDTNRDTPTRYGVISGQQVTDDPGACNKRNRKDSRVYQHYLSRESAAKIPLPQDELVSRSPIGRLSQCSPSMHQPAAPTNGFGVRKPKPATGRDFKSYRKEYTNLSVNVELAAPGHVTCKATDRELMSQADYRRQLTVLLGPIQGHGHTPGDKGEGRIYNEGGCETNDHNDSSCVLRHIPRDKIGPSTRHQIWASDLRLGELLTQQHTTTPDLRRKLANSKVKSMSTTSLNNSGARNNNHHHHNNNNNNITTRRSVSHLSRSFRPFIYGSPMNRFSHSRGYNHKAGNDNIEDDEEDDGDDSDGDEEAWLSMVDTPLVENGVYDRYANVRLPRSRMPPHRGTVRT